MFGLLKNKLASFIKGLSGKEEQKAAQASAEDGAQLPSKAKATPATAPPEEAKPVVAGEKKAAEVKKPEKKEAPKMKKKEEPAPKPEKKETLKAERKSRHADAKPVEAKPAPEPVEEKKPEPQVTRQAEPVPEQKPTPVSIPPKQADAAPKKEEQKKSIIDVLFRKSEPKPAIQTAPKPAEIQKPAALPQKIPVPAEPAQALPEISKQAERDFSRLERTASSAPDKKDIAPKIGIGTALKSIFSNEITIGEGEVSELLSELELSLLEADVAYDVSLDVSSQLRNRLVGMKVPKGKVEEKTREAIQEVLAGVMTSERKFDLVSRVRSLPKPAKILFVGPNGAGKTTTMAKVAHMLLQSGMTVVFSASDTFRAAAIEQTEVHAGKLGVKVVKSKYGADPASVAFDAVNFARTHSIDVVLIDSAGRQDTNANLLDELKKISRVAKPDIKIYIGESIGGNSLLDQVRAFDEAIGMDGAILTKIDCDAKGGTALSLTKSTGIPVLYLGVGQAYADLIPFEPEKIAQEIMG
ncbi:MAG: signal recognition particle-docking protein FtsY [Candidatus Micrarchaeia archaeon]